MLNRLELGIAWRYLRGRRESRLLSFISLIAIGGVMIGVAALIVVMGVMNGLQEDLREKILIGSPDARVLSFGEDLRIDDWRTVLARVRTTDQVTAAAPFVLTQGIITSGRGPAVGTYVSGMAPAEPGRSDPTEIRSRATSGAFVFAPRDGVDGIVVGELLARRLAVQVGDTVNIVTFGAMQSEGRADAAMPTPHAFQVTGLFKTGMYEYDNAYVYVSLQVAQSLAGLDSAVTGIDVATRDRWVAPEVGRTLAERLGYPYRTIDWQEQNSTLFQALRLQKLAMTVILLLIALVAAFTIVSNLTMVVADKTREIGILRAMGMTGRSIGRVFLMQGLVIGLAGTVGGLLLGLLLSGILRRFELVKLDPSVYFIDHLPVATHVGDVFITMLASLTIATLATIMPARTASRMYPVDAIRHE